MAKSDYVILDQPLTRRDTALKTEYWPTSTSILLPLLPPPPYFFLPPCCVMEITTQSNSKRLTGGYLSYQKRHCTEN